jgi:anti-sigma B factor antagonist
MSAVPPFEIDVIEEPDGRRIAVRCELDVATAPGVREQLRRSAGEAREVVLDLREVTFIDSSGLSMLIGADAESRNDGFGLALLASRPVLRLIELCDLQDVLPVRS